MHLLTTQSKPVNRGRGWKLACVVVLCLVTSVATPVAHAKRQADGSHSQTREDSRGRDAGAHEAASQARRQSGGRVLSTQPDGDRYRVKVLTPQGRVKKIVVDRDE